MAFKREFSRGNCLLLSLLVICSLLTSVIPRIRENRKQLGKEEQIRNKLFVALPRCVRVFSVRYNHEQRRRRVLWAY